jgi:hypothetical protein
MIVALLLWRLKWGRVVGERLILAPMCGVAFMAFSSLIDLPFRHPALLFYWCVIVAVSGLIVDSRSVRAPARPAAAMQSDDVPVDRDDQRWRGSP